MYPPRLCSPRYPAYLLVPPPRIIYLLVWNNFPASSLLSPFPHKPLPTPSPVLSVAHVVSHFPYHLQTWHPLTRKDPAMPQPRPHVRDTPEWTIVDFIHRGPWWRNKGAPVHSCHAFGCALINNVTGILSLNLCLILPLLTSAINGFDSSLVNGQYFLLMH